MTSSILKSYLVPDLDMNPCAMWAEKSTQSPMEMTSELQVMTLMVRPMKYMKPATSTRVPSTQRMTSAAPRKLPRKTRTVRYMAASEDPMFWYSSRWMILSVTQLEYLHQ